ncbi:hypothetical protein P168DRAFT_3101 [Aspergillus campestris IBT 28561]|uniref:Uncharacterized protein n=1 Tax=Aspergillus campestris (strain IBT 28561) TaxID=1392248 RepID=A0A2I1DDA5_ASPC2|nr:uncharacterized protein P168DRAFT_3101 [Aspergillus campestris IBT 28561]PKY07830.1 hypothetical protein P168DRAFT_3101 [Aspergillus campestris IBT 28561]
MSDQSIALGREVERLITAPYAPSLQDLYGITQSCSLGVIQSWASRKPCQIGALADVVVDGLSRSNFAVRLLGAFARVESFRNVLLERHPQLLDLFLQKAIEDGEFQVGHLKSPPLS